MTSLFARRVETKELKSACGRERWRYTIAHLINGFETVEGCGDDSMDQLRPMHVETWRAGVGRLITNGQYAPSTAKGWLNILRHIMKRAKRELQLAYNAAEGVPGFDMSEHETYSEEEPNSLTSEEASPFLSCRKEEFPEQYAMTYLGFGSSSCGGPTLSATRS